MNHHEAKSSRRGTFYLFTFLMAASVLPVFAGNVVSISGGDFLINGRLTYEGRKWNGHRIEGLLFNNRVVNGTFEDLNPETVKRWVYPDTGKWDPERNVREFLAAMPERKSMECLRSP